MDAPESRLYVIPASKPAGVLPPFEHECQLIPDLYAHVTNNASALIAERERLLGSLHEDDLERMHKQLWYAGRIGNISPLHHQKVIRREVVLTENPRLHLVWFEKTIFVKRLGDELLNWKYFSDVVCGDQTVHRVATGFLLSYTCLIQYPSDLAVAQATGLVNKDVTWRCWQDFRSSVRHHLADRNVHDRFEYGELRLNRLDQIYRMKGLGLTYFTVYRDYSSYFGDHYMTLVLLFALVSVALSAMQVMAGFPQMPAEVAVTLYCFSIATLVALAGSCSLLLALSRARRGRRSTI
ncbi:hypothetical protein LTR10_007382 [Elasticomyces elasticus]|nr:hypothetical protein LTR10_007382 [Elasticomyces elasticus]KAK4979193.1 hypothetical protein LTR42_001696 [Elasticomyces elasticus]